MIKSAKEEGEGEYASIMTPNKTRRSTAQPTRPPITFSAFLPHLLMEASLEGLVVSALVSWVGWRRGILRVVKGSWR